MQSLRTLILARDRLVSEVRDYTESYPNTMAPPKSQPVAAKPAAEKPIANPDLLDQVVETPAVLSTVLATVANKEEEAAAKKQGMYTPICYQSLVNT